MTKIIYILIIIILLNSCNDSQKKKLNCDAFDYKNGISIFSTSEIDSIAKVIRYKKNKFNKALDTTLVIVRDYTRYEKNKYSIDVLSMNTENEYEIILNDTLHYFFTDIKTTVSAHGLDFMQGKIEMCDIVSYKLNNILIEDKGLSINSALEQYATKRK